MQIIEQTTTFRLPERSAVALGKFDGVHLGHQALIHKITGQKDRGLLAAVFTFDTSPSAFFGGEAEEFVNRYLTEQMQAAYICAGPDLSFGKNGAGGHELLARLSKACGYQVELIDKVVVDGEEVSSTRVRDAVRQGRMEAAARMLGEPYSLAGTVEHGRKLGRTIGMPTANLMPETDKLLPPNGVYYSRVRIEDKVYKGITNVGCKPTVSEEHRMGAETYLYDFAGNIYGRDIRVELLSFRRPEMKFDSVEKLKAQMMLDIAAGQEYPG